MLDSFWSQQSLGKGKKRNNVIAASWPPDTHYSNETSLLSYTHVRICLLRHVFFFANKQPKQTPTSFVVKRTVYNYVHLYQQNCIVFEFPCIFCLYVTSSQFKDRIASKLILFLCCATELKRKKGGKNKGGRRKHKNYRVLNQHNME